MKKTVKTTKAFRESSKSGLKKNKGEETAWLPGVCFSTGVPRTYDEGVRDEKR